MGGLIGFSVGRPQRVWSGVDAAAGNHDSTAGLLPGPYVDFRTPVPFAPAFQTPAATAPPPSPMPAPHPGFFAHGGLGTRIFNGLGNFATNYLALNGNRAALETLDAEQRAAEQAALLREQSLRRAGGANSLSLEPGMVPVTAPGFSAG